ncbi:unnamed protein product [Timema podura]|uniref:Uncharacterized protein n=1 Tax=Timema podura TaxID=61482 RepID=A0ABN7NJL4_TIMPD|nr:unnamed protein product [Timema podura]
MVRGVILAVDQTADVGEIQVRIFVGSLFRHQHGLSLSDVADRVALVAAPPSYTRMYHYYPYCYYPRYPGGMYMKPEDGNMYTTLEPTLSSNPNVFFQRGGVHPGMMY